MSGGRKEAFARPGASKMDDKTDVRVVFFIFLL
jgi:hypothetical protein